MNRHFVIAIGTIAFTAAFAPMLGEGPGETFSEQSEPAVGEAAPRPRPTAAYAAGATVLRRDGSGQFHMTARVNGSDTRFLVDTGADVVALTTSDAEAMGIELAEEDFLPIMRTASGTGYGAPVTLDRIEIGETEFRNVEAVVIRGLGTNLLGQSVLRRLGKVELQGDRMILRH